MWNVGKALVLVKMLSSRNMLDQLLAGIPSALSAMFARNQLLTTFTSATKERYIAVAILLKFSNQDVQPVTRYVYRKSSILKKVFDGA